MLISIYIAIVIFVLVSVKAWEKKGWIKKKDPLSKRLDGASRMHKFTRTLIWVALGLKVVDFLYLLIKFLVQRQTSVSPFLSGQAPAISIIALYLAILMLLNSHKNTTNEAA